VPVPVIGNGDLLHGHEIRARLGDRRVAGVMVARGALIKPWLFRDAQDGDRDPSADERLALYRRYVALGLAHWGDDDHGRARLREFLRWHVGFWCRFAPRRPDGSYPTMQQREAARLPDSALDALLARSDDAALDYVTDELLAGGDLSRPPAAGESQAEPDPVEAG
jgi:tRNA-dihydrouridine synthase 3